MSIERGPLKIHKNLVIRALTLNPKDCKRIAPSFQTAEEAIAALKAHPGEWIVDGVLEDAKSEKSP